MLGALLGGLALWAVSAPVSAQTGAPPPAPSIPGLVVSMPPGQAQPAPPPSIPGLMVTTPPAPPPPAAAQPPPKAKLQQAKPKPKPSSTKSASAAAASSAVATSALDKGGSGTRIVALVNDEPITGFAVEQRARFMALSSNIGERAKAQMQAIAQDPRTNERLKAILQETIQANQGKTREQVIAAFEVRKKAFVTSLQKQAIEGARSGIIPTMRKPALQELIEERLKLQEAKKLTISVAEADIEKVFKDMAQRNQMTSAQFAEHISRQGADADVIRSRLRASLAWREVVRKRYGHHISVSARDIEALAVQAGGEQALELKLQMITLATEGTVDQRSMATRLAEASAVRGAYKGCATMAGLIKDRANAKFQDLDFKKPSALAEPTRSLLLAAKDGDMLPASLSAGGVELYAVCGRRTLKVDEDKRQAAESQLTMKEFEKLAQRYLHDLRKDALIEIR